MSDRFTPGALFRGHWKGMSDYRPGHNAPDWVARTVFVLLPVIAGVAMGIWGEIRSPAPILTALALLAGGFLSSFTHLSTLRLRLTERAETWGDAEQFDRDAIDETATHLLFATYLAGVSAAAVAIGMNVNRAGVLSGWFAGVTSAAVTYLILLFLVAVPRLYAAYLQLNSVSDRMSGAHRELTRRPNG